MKERTEFRVVVGVEEPSVSILSNREARWTSVASDVAESIKRHVDDISYVNVEWDNKCDFCNSNWEVAEKYDEDGIPEGQPLCCDEAIKEWEQEHPDALEKEE